MAAVAAFCTGAGTALARGGPRVGRSLARFLRAFSVHEGPLSTLNTEEAVAPSTESEGSNLHEQSVRSQSDNRIYLVSQREPTVHELPDALKALRAYSLADFVETVEVSLCCKLVTKKGKRRDPFRGSIIFPHPFGKEPKLLVFAEGAAAEAAKGAGADTVGGAELIVKVLAGGVKGFDLCLASEDLADKIKPLQKKLRKLMPTSRRGTVVGPLELERAVSHFKKSREYKCDKQGNCNVAIGKLRFEDHKIAANLQFLVRQVLEHRDTQPKATFIQKIVLSSTYGPGFMLSMKDVMRS